MMRITVAIAPEPSRTRILVAKGSTELMRAVLGPAGGTHPRAATTLLEGLSLWHQQALDVVLCVDEKSPGSDLHLCDELGFGGRSVYYDVGIAFDGIASRRQRCRGLGGLGDFRLLRRLMTEVDR